MHRLIYIGLRLRDRGEARARARVGALRAPYARALAWFQPTVRLGPGLRHCLRFISLEHSEALP